MESLCSKYENPNNFDAPLDLWSLPSDEDRNILWNCLLSISQYALGVIGNIHNMIMSSTEHSKWVKLGIVVLLDIACLAVICFAAAEILIRTAITIISLPFLAYTYFIEDNALGPLLILPVLTTIGSIAAIPNSFYTLYNVTTSTRTINPEAIGQDIFNFMTCDKLI